MRVQIAEPGHPRGGTVSSKSPEAEPGHGSSPSFLPESLTRTAGLAFLSPSERVALNHVKACSYLAILETMEALLARDSGGRQEGQSLAALRGQLRHAFGSPCGVFRADVSPSDAPGSVALGTLHLAWLAVRHVREAAFENEPLDPRFRVLFLHRAERAERRSALGVALLDLLAAEGTPLLVAQAVDDYLAKVSRLHRCLEDQAEHDLDSLVRATGRTFSPLEKDLFLHVQAEANRSTFLGAAMTHPGFLRAASRLGAAARDRIEDVARELWLHA